MKILHLTTYLQGGAGRIIHDLAIAQRRSGDRVTIVTSKTPYPGYCNYQEFLDSLRNEEIDLVEVDSLFRREPSLTAEATTRIGALLQSDHYDLIHCHSGTPSEIALQLRSNLKLSTPIVQTMHGWGNNKTPEQERYNRDILNRLDAVTALSDSNRRLLEFKGVQTYRINIIPYGIGPNSCQPPPEARERLRAPASGKRIIGCIGSLCDRKNQRLLIDAFPSVKGRHPNAALVFIGEGEIEPELRQRAKDIGIADDTVFLGYQPHADSFIPMFEVLCLPSRAEGLPITILESFRDRVPVVASDIPELKEVIRDGRNGLIFQPDRVEALAAALDQALSWSPEEKMAITTAARSDFDQLYRRDCMVAAYRTLYERLIDETANRVSAQQASDA